MNNHLFTETWGCRGTKCNANPPRLATTVVLMFFACVLIVSMKWAISEAHGDQNVFICGVAGVSGLPYDRFSSGDPKPACEASAESHIPGECKLVPVFNTITRLLRRVRNGECYLDFVREASNSGGYKCPMRYIDCNDGSFWGGQDYRYDYHLTGVCPDGDEINPFSGTCEAPSVCPAGQVRKRGKCIVPPMCSGVGNPCDAATGNKSQTETDYASDGTGIGLTRAYNSAQPRNIGFGVGWTSSLARQLIINGEELVVQRGNGWQDPFSRQEAVWQGDTDTDFIVVEDAAGFNVLLPAGDTEQYDASGRLLSETSTSGLSTTYRYGPDDRLSDITGPYGHTMSLAYDGAGNIIAVTDPDNQVYSYTYDSNENLVEVQYPDGSTRGYHYEDADFPNHLTGITDGNGERYANYAYDDHGRAISTGHARTDGASPQQRYLLEYAGPSSTVVTDPIGELWDYSYQQSLGLYQLISRTSRSDARGVVQQFDAGNNLVARTDEEGRTTTHTYNATNQRTSTTVAAASVPERTTFYEYMTPDIDLLTRVLTPSVFSGSARQVSTIYDDNFNISSVTIQGFDPAGNELSRVTNFEYDGSGRITQIDGPRTDVDDITVMSYNECDAGVECGQLAHIVNALGHTTTFDAYDAHGRLIASTDPNGVATTRNYDLRGRLTSVSQTPPTGAARITTFGYDGAGQTTSVIAPDGVILGYSYDAAHDLRSITDNLGNKIEYAYDLKGNRIREDTRDPDGTLVRTIQTTYDLRDRIRSINTAGSVTQTLRDAVGNLLVETDPNFNPDTTHSYDALNRLTQTMDALSNPTAYQYDEQDNVRKVTAPNGAVTGYDYDDLGNLLKETSPDRGGITYTHDGSGNVATITDARGITATYSYDALNRVTNIDLPGTVHDQFLEYDTCTGGIGRLCGTIDKSGVTRLDYDSFGNVLTHTRAEDGQALITHYQYDAGNRVEQTTYPYGGIVTYGRDSLGRITEVDFDLNGRVVPVLSQRSYRADGLVTSQISGNGLTETRQYDQQGRLIAQTLGAIDSRTYQYDANGNQLGRDQTTVYDPAPVTASYAYDVLNRISGDSGPKGVFAFTYDTNSNRLTRSKDGIAGDYQYAALSNRATGANNKAVSIDAAGNTTSDRNGKRTFQYDATGRLEKFSKNGVLKATYFYNVRGQRTRKIKETANGRKTFLYHYDNDGNLIAETKNGKALRYYIWADNQPVMQIRLKQTNTGTVSIRHATYITTDHLLTPRLGTDQSQAIVWRWDGDAFGQTGADKDPDANGENRSIRLRFPGQFHDGESGLYYNWNRYYDPKTGRYITSDPIGLRGGPSTYAYAYGNPNKFVDPMGLIVEGHWMQRPTPQILSATPMPGAYRPPFLENFSLLPLPNWVPIVIPYQVDLLVNWKVGCKETGECTERSWEIEQTTPRFSLNFGYKFKLGFHPSYQRWLSLFQGIDLLILPDAVKKTGQYVEQAFGGISATMMCLTFPEG